MKTPDAIRAEEPTTIVDALRRHARDRPRRPAFVYLPNGETRGATFDYRTLHERARSVGAWMQAHALTGERVLLLQPPSADYVVGLLGCLYAGAIPVPAYPPHRKKLRHTMERLAGIVADAGARAVIGARDLLADARDLWRSMAATRDIELLVLEDCDPSGSHSWSPADLDEDSVAFLQYTSGVTAAPRGVVVTHGNLTRNLAMIRDCYGLGARDCGVIWLPPYHDMGLIGGILEPIFAGFPVLLFPPLYFIQRPARWLRAIAHHGATISGGPNFAYDLCARKIPPEERAGLDLTRWRVAFCGAEPVRAQTLDRFARTFAPNGFSTSAFHPCYGLAEATLFVTGVKKRAEPVQRSFHAEELRAGRARPALDQEDATTLVGCGRPFDSLELVVVDPESRRRLAEGEVGEIWLRGPTVAAGYWNRPVESEATFAARLAGDSEARYLRTGDLGFVEGGETFVTGRRKELILVRGRNHYPQDVEHTVESSHPALEPACGAAFSMEIDGEEKLVVVQALRREAVRGLNADEVARDVVEAVGREHGLEVHRVLFTTAPHIPRTSSGKVMRGACRERVLTGSLEEVGRDPRPRSGEEPETPGGRGT